MKLIIGLGNPGRNYMATRHNIGFDTITRLSDDLRIAVDAKKHKGLCGQGMIGSERILLVQPQTYMNLSGECVRELVDFFKLTAEDVIIICDDADLSIGQIRVRKKGSAGTHNGLKSIIAHLGTDEFNRVRVGIGARPEQWDMCDYVLSRFSAEEEPAIRKSIETAAAACRAIVMDGVDAAMNIYNRKPPKEKEED